MVKGQNTGHHVNNAKRVTYKIHIAVRYSANEMVCRVIQVDKLIGSDSSGHRGKKKTFI
jgi:hypothetical protein